MKQRFVGSYFLGTGTTLYLGLRLALSSYIYIPLVLFSLLFPPPICFICSLFPLPSSSRKNKVTKSCVSTRGEKRQFLEAWLCCPQADMDEAAGIRVTTRHLEADCNSIQLAAEFGHGVAFTLLSSSQECWCSMERVTDHSRGLFLSINSSVRQMGGV